MQFQDMCPKPNETIKNPLSKKSHHGELQGIPGLFSAFTDEPDLDEKWSVVTFPVDFDSSSYGSKNDKDQLYFREFCESYLCIFKEIYDFLSRFF